MLGQVSVEAIFRFCTNWPAKGIRFFGVGFLDWPQAVLAFGVGFLEWLF